VTQLVGILSTMAVAVIAIFVLVGVIIYSIRLQRRSVSTQKAVVESHFEEKSQRQRQYAIMEQSLQLQRESIDTLRQAQAKDEEVRELLRRLVKASEEMLAELRESRRKNDG